MFGSVPSYAAGAPLCRKRAWLPPALARPAGMR
jgi:hypothetical protein